MTRHIYLKSEILATKIRMAEICRVLLVTLLLCLYWMPSDTRGESDVTNSDENNFETIPPEAGAAAGQDPDMVKHGWSIINQLLDAYFRSNCGAARAVADNVGPMEGSGYSVGQIHIIELLSTYFRSDCKATENVKAKVLSAMQDPGCSAGEKRIIELLATYASSGCKASLFIPTLDPNYTKSENNIISLLSTYFRSDCKGSGEGGSGKGGSGKGGSGKGGSGKGGSGEGGDDTGGRHVQSFVLELFLLILGVCLTRIEL